MQPAAFLCVICAICGRIFTREYSINPHKRNPRSLPQIIADKTQNNNNYKNNYKRMNLTTNPACLSLRNNAACCIPLRDLRYLRENNTQEDSINIPRRNPKCLPLIYADKPQNSNNCNNPKQPVFLCGIMQLAAFLSA